MATDGNAEGKGHPGATGDAKEQSSNVGGQRWDKDLSGPQPATVTGRPASSEEQSAPQEEEPRRRTPEPQQPPAQQDQP